MAGKPKWLRTGAALAALAAGATVALVAGGPAAPAFAAAPVWYHDNTQAHMQLVRAVVSAGLVRTTLPGGGWEESTGKGVGIALIDTGVTQVPGLNSGQVVNGPDLSFESQDPEQRYLDTNGHGTHLAGIIAGRPLSTSDVNFRGMAPQAKLTSIKIGIRNGAVDVIQAIAAIDWAVAHRNDDPANPIRIINLAYGTNGGQDYKTDPLAHAVENAWKAGIVVVVAGGNDGATGKLVNPAYDPYVLTVGALDTNNTLEVSDDQVASFTTRGNSTRSVDIIAPGRSIVSLRVPGSSVDTAYPGARVDDMYFKGSGSSQASAVVSGALALLLQHRPTLTPDQVKYLIKNTPKLVPDPLGGYRTKLSISQNVGAATPSATTAAQTFTRSTGRGKLELARGSVHLIDGSSQLTGEKDFFGNTFDVYAWAAASSAKTAWSGGKWMGRNLAGSGWTTDSDGTKSWSGRYWAGKSWSGRYWASTTWSSIGWLGYGWV